MSNYQTQPNRSESSKTKDDVNEHVPSLDELEAMREHRDIKPTHISEAIGFKTDGGWWTSIEKDTMSPQKRLLALAVFEFYDRKGYCPIIEVL